MSTLRKFQQLGSDITHVWPSTADCNCIPGRLKVATSSHARNKTVKVAMRYEVWGMWEHAHNSACRGLRLHIMGFFVKMGRRGCVCVQQLLLVYMPSYVTPGCITCFKHEWDMGHTQTHEQMCMFALNYLWKVAELWKFALSIGKKFCLRISSGEQSHLLAISNMKTSFWVSVKPKLQISKHHSCLDSWKMQDKLNSTRYCCSVMFGPKCCA